MSVMKCQQAFKFQLLPNGEQQRKMRQFAGCCRWVFNEVLSRQVEHRENDGKFIPYVKMTHWLVEWKNSAKHRWLGEAPSQVLEQALQSKFLCVACGYMANADLNTAQNILAQGMPC